MTKRKSLLLVGIFIVVTSSVQAQDPEPLTEIANYTFEVRLDTENRRITGYEIIEWTNVTETPADELRLHLYWNGFQNSRSSFLSEGYQRWGKIIKNFSRNDWGYCRIRSFQILENDFFQPLDLTSSLRFIRPDDNNTEDQTVLAIPLPQPVPPSTSIKIKIDFQAKIPTPIHRTGAYRDYYFIAQWYPKLGVFENGHWNCHQFHATSNFYADFGTYDVKIRIPSEYIIGTTGDSLEEMSHEDGTVTHHFRQEKVHDFAWTASPDFLKITEVVALDPDKSVEIILLLQPYHKGLSRRYLTAVKNSLMYCHQRIGEYPYSSVTCVDPAYNSRTGGMEYPKLFTAGAHFFSHPRTPSPEGVTIHEFVHGYFYGLIATNEFENAWMDEGITSFLDSEIYYAAYRPPLFSRRYFGIPVVFPDAVIPIEASGISRHRLTSDMDIMQLPTWEFMNRESYGANSYAKAELMLRSLQRFIGRERFEGALQAYYREFRYRHPRPQDFYAVLSTQTGEDLSWFLDQLLFSSGRLDYAVGGITNREIHSLEGWSNEEYISTRKRGNGSRSYAAEVLVRRLGEITLPVEVLVVFENGRVIRESWDGRYRWKKFLYQTPVKVEKVFVDPDFKYVLDVNRTNNSMTIKPDRWAPLKWAANWMVWIQHALETLAMIGG